VAFVQVMPGATASEVTPILTWCSRKPDPEVRRNRADSESVTMQKPRVLAVVVVVVVDFSFGTTASPTWR